MAKQYWAQLIEFDEEMQSSCISGATDHEDAAETLISDFVGQMGGEITSGAIRVWVPGGQEKRYDWMVHFELPDDDDGLADDEDFEIEAEIELIERVAAPRMAPGG